MAAISYPSPTGNPYVDGLFSGVAWATPQLTFSFPSDPAFYGSPYGQGEPQVNFQAFTPVQQEGVRDALRLISSVANLSFVEVTETATVHADLRYAESDVPPTAYAYFPGTVPEAGDSWYSNSTHYFDVPLQGTYASLVFLHETGHALGLKHPHEVTSGPGGSFGAVPLDHDSLEYSVMSYRSYVNTPTFGFYTNGPTSYPQTLMMNDIGALQAMYGANYSTNSGNTVYSWDPASGQMFVNGTAQYAVTTSKIFLTIWDGGGLDTYNFSNYATPLNVSLQPGGWTTCSSSQLAELASGVFAVGNIANAFLYNNNPLSLIENAICGTGSDTVVGNIADNRFTGGAGNDTLTGGAGSDTAVYSGLYANYSIVQNPNGTYTVVDLRSGSPDGTDTLSGMETLLFSDRSFTLVTQPPPTSGQTFTANNSRDQVLVGGAGDDTFYAGRNSVILTGGAGADKFVYQYLPWNNTGHITDFTLGTDRLDFSALFAASGYTGKNPVADGYVRFESDGAGGTRVYYDTDGPASGSPWPFLMTTLDHISPSGLTAAQVFDAGGNPPPPPPPPPPPSKGQTFTANGSRDQIMNGGSGDDIFYTGHNSVILTGGGGADRFVYQYPPWNNTGHIRDFTAGVDVLDLRPLFAAAGYSGTNPLADGHLRFVSDGAGGTQVLFDPDGNGTGNPWPFLITTLDKVQPTGIHQGDFLFA